jgi:beta-lactamase regulating signal transducer with metallopeptidase domain
MITDPYAAWVAELAIDVFIKASLVLGIAGLVTWFLRECSAATRHAVWTIAFGCLLALPFLSLSMPGWRVEGLGVNIAASEGGIEAAGGDYCDCAMTLGTSRSDFLGGPGARLGTAGTSDDEPRGYLPSGDNTQGRARIPIGALLFITWGVGAVVVLGRFLVGAFQVHRIARRAAECSLDVRSVAVPLAHGLGIKRELRVLVSDEITVPLSWGLLAPVVLLPRAADAWTVDRKRVVLLHELAHAKRFDYAAHVLCELAKSIYWPNPLVWFAARLNSIECERACDDLALDAGVRSDIYAGHLVDIARGQLRVAPRGAFAMARPSSLATRVKSILTEGLERSPMSRLALIIVGLAGLALVLPTATLDLWGRGKPGTNVIQRVLQSGGSVDQRIAELDDRDARVRRFAAWALGELERERGVRPLIEHLVDDDADVRLVSAWALGEIKDHMAIVPLIELLEDDDPLVREMAVLSLGEIEDESAISPLLDAVERDRDLMEPAIWALGEIGDEAYSARRALLRELGSRARNNRQVWTGRLGSTGAARDLSGDLNDLIDALGSRDAELRCSAAEWLGVRGDERAVEPLLDTLRDPDPAVRAMAVWALDEINPSRH